MPRNEFKILYQKQVIKYKKEAKKSAYLELMNEELIDEVRRLRSNLREFERMNTIDAEMLKG